MNLKKFLAIFLVFSCLSQVNAQDNFYKAIRVAVKKIESNDYIAAREAIEIANKEATSDEQRMSLSLLSANIDAAQGKIEAAQKSFLGIAKNEKLPAYIRRQAYNAIGNIYSSQGKYDEERAAYKEIYKLSDSDVFYFYDMQTNIASSLYREGKTHLAHLELDKVLLRRDIDLYTLTLAQLDIAAIYFDEANYKAAREMLGKVLNVKEALAPQDYQDNIRDNKQKAALGLAKSYLLEKDYAKASEEFKKVLAIKDLTKENRDEAKAQLKALEKAKNGAVSTQTAPK